MNDSEKIAIDSEVKLMIRKMFIQGCERKSLSQFFIEIRKSKSSRGFDVKNIEEFPLSTSKLMQHIL
ncbi:CLUMA_CG005576, isoform A [Clunio marinus]|uniref:CLUMA_CG005576, isoform A n=1 Tax=Clunio marinus TaxID=568069 RepID=A0A1J1HXB8_9DIPT|nr:CLUMA_CG005576, isoform A [Clunio marinus]